MRIHHNAICSLLAVTIFHINLINDTIFENKKKLLTENVIFDFI